MGFDPQSVRTSFPALHADQSGTSTIFFDGPTRTQVPISVIGAISNYYVLSTTPNANAFAANARATELTYQARQSTAHFINAADPDCIVFGANVTTLTYAISAAYGRTLSPGDEVIITDLDHEANRAPWLDFAEQGVVIRIARIDPETGTLPVESVTALITPQTRLIAVSLASNITGSLVDVARISKAAHEVGAVVFVDANHYVAHAPINVQELDCDFLVFAFYKCFGPHVGVLWGKREFLERLTPHQLPSAPQHLPWRWEYGAPNYPGLAGIASAVLYLSNIGAKALLSANSLSTHSGNPLPTTVLHTGMRSIQAYERTLSAKMLEMFALFPEIRILGLTDPARLDERVPTFSFVWNKKSPRIIETVLEQHAISCSRGNFYCLHLLQQMNVDSADGIIRLGLLHYNTAEEIMSLQTALESLRDAPSL